MNYRRPVENEQSEVFRYLDESRYPDSFIKHFVQDVRRSTLRFDLYRHYLALVLRCVGFKKWVPGEISELLCWCYRLQRLIKPKADATTNITTTGNGAGGAIGYAGRTKHPVNGAGFKGSAGDSWRVTGADGT